MTTIESILKSTAIHTERHPDGECTAHDTARPAELAGAIGQGRTRDAARRDLARQIRDARNS